MSYFPVRSGYTGPAGQIGAGTEYHIDLKVKDTTPLTEKIKAFDALAKQYQSIGREIEFSNQGVSGLRYDPSLPLDERGRILMQAAAAHAPRQGWRSFDYYVPFKGKSRFDKGAVEGASIFLPGVAGGKVRRGTAGDYGFYSESLDPSGNVIFKVGHGDIRRPESGDVNVLGTAPPPRELPPPSGQSQKATAEKEKKDPMRSLLFQTFLSQMNQPSLMQGILEQELAGAISAQPFQGLLG